MQYMNKHVSAFCALLMGGLVLSIMSGCAGGNPFIGQAEDQLENQNYEQALVSIDSALARNPQNAQAYMLRAQILSQQADSTVPPERYTELIQGAREAQEKAISIDPSLRSDVQTRRQLAYIQQMQSGATYFNRARQNQDSRQFRAAAARFNAAAIIYPDSASAYLNEAYALINAGNQEGAIQPMKSYVEASDSVGVDNYKLLGQLYLTNNQSKEAIPVLEEAADRYPNSQDIQSLLLNAYNQAGMQEEAIKAYQAQIERHPDNALYRYNLGSLYLNSDQYEEAIEQLSRAIEIDPENANAQYNLGAAYVNKAVAINDSIRVLEDRLRTEGSELSESEQKQLNAQMQRLAQQRRQLFEQAIPPLERARQMADAANRQRICSALYTAYVQTEQMNKAREVESCAGGGSNQ